MFSTERPRPANGKRGVKRQESSEYAEIDERFVSHFTTLTMLTRLCHILPFICFYGYKIDNFQMKNHDIFLNSTPQIHCGYL